MFWLLVKNSCPPAENMNGTPFRVKNPNWQKAHQLDFYKCG